MENSNNFNEIVRICKIHGDLTLKEVIKNGKDRNGNQLYKCKTCTRKLKNHYYHNDEKTKKTLINYRKNNPEIFAKIHRKQYLKNIDRERLRSRLYRLNNLEEKKEYQKKYRKEKRVKIGLKYKEKMIEYKKTLNDVYIKTLLSRQNIAGKGRLKIKSDMISAELIDLKRILILIKNEIKERKKYEFK